MTTSEDNTPNKEPSGAGHRQDQRRDRDQLKEMIIHLAFYAGWQRAMSAIMVAKEVFAA
jgi:hypothetical protein